ncbi:hypothetical protein ACN28E_33680 [Archangium lansingense]|uniref:hypothetical protein n=1 Tax=Archangium lansingense TaxID=2995310 RepID=UPI003B7702DF
MIRQAPVLGWHRTSDLVSRGDYLLDDLSATLGRGFARVLNTITLSDVLEDLAS